MKRAIFLTLASIGDQQRRSENKLWCEFETERSCILGGLLDAAAHGLRALPDVHLDQLPRMADFASWATACETALWPAGTFAQAYEANRRTAIEDVADADPVAACVQKIMATRSIWIESAADLLRAGVNLADDAFSRRSAGGPKNPRALSGRLRRAQAFLRVLGIEITFSREGRAGNRIIRMRATAENSVSTVRTVSSIGNNSFAPPPARTTLNSV